MYCNGHDEEPASRVPGGLNVVVTGAAGFIGSHLVDALLVAGCSVTGIDNFDPWYDPTLKQANLAKARAHDDFALCVDDLAALDLVAAFAESDVIFHLAGRPGVQPSWGSGFEATCHLNISLTQRVMDAALAAGVPRVVLASSSSVYGNGARNGSRAVDPISPYGVSKAASEQLAKVYQQRGLDVVCLRYFTVFGPRQRPDMAMHRLFRACLGGEPFWRRGSGDQQREFTYVDDVVAATITAGVMAEASGETLDIGGGCTASLNDVIVAIEAVTATEPVVRLRESPPGDPDLTTAELASARQLLGWEPATDLAEGLASQWRWHQALAGDRTILPRRKFRTPFAGTVPGPRVPGPRTQRQRPAGAARVS